MTVPSALGPAVRRWPFAVLGTVITLFVALFLSSGVAPIYSSTASVILLPGSQSMPDNGNPFLFMGNLFQARDVVVLSLGTEQVAKRVVGNDNSGLFSAVADGTSNAPIINLQVWSSSLLGATKARDTALKELNTVVDGLQDQAQTPEKARFRTLTVSAQELPDMSDKGRTRALIMYTVLGLGLTFGLVALGDLVLQARTRRRRSQVGSEPPCTLDSPDAPASAARTQPDGSSEMAMAEAPAAVSTGDVVAELPTSQEDNGPIREGTEDHEPDPPKSSCVSLGEQSR